MGRCAAEWATEIDDEDGDGEARHWCFRDSNHDDWHICAEHLACAPVAEVPEWADEY